MEKAGLTKLVQPDFTASFRPTAPRLVVTDKHEIPAEYWRPQPPKLDRVRLLSALRAGLQICGATLGNGAITLAVRTL